MSGAVMQHKDGGGRESIMLIVELAIIFELFLAMPLPHPVLQLLRYNVLCLDGAYDVWQKP